MTITDILALVTTGLAVVLAVLKFLDRIKIQGLEQERAKATDVVTALGEAIDELKPILGPADARILTGTIQDRAGTKGVLGDLDRILGAAGLNTKTRGQLLQSGATPVPPVTPLPLPPTSSQPPPAPQR